MPRTFVRLLLVMGCLIIPGIARAQSSAIAGQVTDLTGAVLPGVTVEVTSPNLIGGARTVVSDGQGRYTVEQLPPGTYKVTFTLPGFNTLIRDGIELTTNFTAPISVQLGVGSVEETLTVSGASPIVDTARTVTQTVMNRDTLDTLPEGRGYAQAGVLIPGFVASSPDVGGSSMMHQKYLTVHGSTAAQTIQYIDGMNAACALSTGSTPCNYVDVGAMQEIAYTSGGGTAEMQVGGVVTNMVPKSGGDRVSFQSANFYSDKNFVRSNITPELTARGLTAPPSLVKQWDYDENIGGPIMKSKLWYFGAYRDWGVNSLYSSSFITATGEQTTDLNHLQSFLAKLNYQASSKDNVTAMYVRMPRWRGSYSIAPGVNWEASGDNHAPNPSLGQVKWTGVRTSKLLTEVGLSTVPYVYQVYNSPGTTTTTPSKRDLVSNVTYNNQATATKNFTLALNLMGAVSYVTGTHSVKLGFQHKNGYVRTRSNSNGNVNVGNVQQLYQSGRPFAVNVYNSPTERQSNIDHDLGIYIQDSWKINRLTINPGLRFDYFRGSNPEQSAPASDWVPARTVAAAKDVPNWKDISPRFGAAYDIFGDAKTVAKISAGKYVFQDSVSYASKYNLLNLVSEQRTWTDSNTNDIAERGEIGPARNAQFGLPGGTTTLDPDNKRPYDLLVEASLQRELSSRIGVQVSWGYRKTKNALYQKSLTVDPNTDYTLFYVPDPRNGEQLPVWNLNPAKNGLVGVSNIDTTSDVNSPTIFQGFGGQMTMRFGRGGNLLTGFDTGTTNRNTCDFPGGDPNYYNSTTGVNGLGADSSARFCDTTQYDVPYRTQFKLSGSYPLPYGISVGAVYQNVPGPERNLTYLVTKTAFPQLTLSSVTVPVTEPGELYYDRLNQIDLKFSKTFRYKAMRIVPQVDWFNVSNANTILRMVNQLGPTLNNVQSILDPGFVRFGLTINY